MKIRPVGEDGHTDAMKITVALRGFAEAPQNSLCEGRVRPFVI